MTSKELENKYADLLLDADFLQLKLLQQKPNIFEALKIVRYENRHSNFLAWLLDPAQTHGLEEKFLQLFLADIFRDDRIKSISVTEIIDLPLHSAEVHREWNRIDILIKIKDVIVVIENKVWSGEHGNQLEMYNKLIEEKFGNAKKAYVFLSPYGSNSSMDNIYVNYSYAQLLNILITIKNIYSFRLSSAVLQYILDYIDTIKKHFMNNSEVNVLARKIYSNHKDLFNFILQHTPNPYKELYDYFEIKLKEMGWVKCFSEKAYVRFLTANLNPIIPRNGNAWKKEAFLFEFYFGENFVAFYYTIAPGDEDTRETIRGSLIKIKDIETEDIDPAYICFSYIEKEINSDIMNLSDKKFLDNHLTDFWSFVLPQVIEAEKQILSVKNDLL